MPAMAFAESGGGGKDFPAKLTSQVIVCTIIAAFGGLMFGYDIGISGPYTSTTYSTISFYFCCG
jgi:hypothetical protein